MSPSRMVRLMSLSATTVPPLVLAKRLVRCCSSIMGVSSFPVPQGRCAAPPGHAPQAAAPPGVVWFLPQAAGLEQRHDRAVVGRVNVVLDVLALHSGQQRLDGGVVLAAFLDDEDVGVGLGSLRG